MDIKMKGIVTMAQERRDEPETVQGSLSETAQKTGRDVLQETEQRTGQEMLPETEQKTKSSGDSVFAGIYDQLPDISVKSVDRFILICAIALVAVILVGVLKANHIF